MKIETPLLRRLGPVPFWRGERKCLQSLEAIYRRIRERAAERVAAGGGGAVAPDPSATGAVRRQF